MLDIECDVCRRIDHVFEFSHIPNGNCQYRSEIDGHYYKSYIGSPDCAEDAFGEATRKCAEALKKELFR